MDNDALDGDHHACVLLVDTAITQLDVVLDSAVEKKTGCLISQNPTKLSSTLSTHSPFLNMAPTSFATFSTILSLPLKFLIVLSIVLHVPALSVSSNKTVFVCLGMLSVCQAGGLDSRAPLQSVRLSTTPHL